MDLTRKSKYSEFLLAAASVAGVRVLLLVTGISFLLVILCAAAEPTPEELEALAKRACEFKADDPLTPEQEQEIRKKAVALFKQGLEFKARGQLTEAAKAFEENLKLARQLFPRDKYPQGRPELAQTLENLGLVYRLAQDDAKALSCYEEVLAIRQALYPKNTFPQGHADVAWSLGSVGMLLHQRGDHVRSFAHLQQMLEMCRTLYPRDKYPDGHMQLAFSLELLGAHHLTVAELDKAVLHYQQALAIWQTLYPRDKYPRGHIHLASSLALLGATLRDRADYGRALSYARQALEMRQELYPKSQFPLGHPDLILSLDQMGDVLAGQGEYGQSLGYYEQALAMRQALYPKEKFPAGHPQIAAGLNKVGAGLVLRREDGKALQYLLQSLAMQQALYPKEKYPNGHADLATSLSNLGTLLARGEQYQKAADYYQQALPMIEGLYPKEQFPLGHPQIASCLSNLGAALERSGEPDKALPIVQRSLEMRQALYPKASYPRGHPDLVLSLHNLGDVWKAKKDHAQGLAFVRQALIMRQELFELFAAQASEAEAFNFLTQGPETQALYLSIANRAKVPADETYADIWRSKAAIAQLLHQRHLGTLATADERTRKLGEELLETRRRVARLLLAPGAGPSHLQQLKDLSRRKEELERQLAQALPELSQQQALARQPHTEIAKRLPPRTCFIDFFRYNEERKTAHNVAFVLRPGQPVQRVELGPAEPTDKAIVAWRSEIADKGTSSGGPELRRLIWDRLAAHIPTDTEVVYLALGPPLASVPWAALPGRKNGTVLLEDHALALVPHAPFLLEQLTTESSKTARPELMLAVGAVEYGKPPTPVKTPPDGLLAGRAPELGGRAITWTELPGTRAELERVVELAGKRPVLARRGAAASVAQILTDLGNHKAPPRYAHFATHGFFADPRFRSALQVDDRAFERFSNERASPGARNPLVLSGLVFAGANVAARDPLSNDNGILTAEAIAGLPLHQLDLVVLSACETGLGEAAAGEGVLGLQRAFHIAGAHNVVASLWQVNDDATAALMAIFYDKLWREGKTPVVALREAQLTLYRHPERITKLARERGPDFDKVVRLPAEAARDPKDPPADRAPAKLWAGFTLSGAGR